jgi:hypothetical protein
MKKLILPVLLLFLCSMTLRPTDCSRFRNGKFRSTLQGKPYFVERHGDFQTEYIGGTPDSTIFTFHVKWIGDCTYTIVPTEETIKKFPNLPKNVVLTSEIIRTTDTSYTTKVTSNFSTLIDTGTYTRVK